MVTSRDKEDYNNKFDAGTSAADKINLAPEAVLSNTDQSGVLTNGLVTGTKVRILEDPSNLSSGKWLTTTMFYDNKARVIQTQSENAVGGKDITCVRYDFTGKVRQITPGSEPIYGKCNMAGHKYESPTQRYQVSNLDKL